MVDDTKSGILNDEPDEAHRRLQQGFEALRAAFSCNRKVESVHEVTVICHSRNPARDAAVSGIFLERTIPDEPE
jgi:hypothetical protein